MWTRRNLLFASAVAVASASISHGGASAEPLSQEDLAARAFIWGIPIVLLSRYRKLADLKGFPFNQFISDMKIARPGLDVAQPNIDTLYGYAWWDLTEGPMVLSVPDTSGRYYSMQFQDAYQHTFAYVGRRATGTKAGVFVLTPPGWSGTLPPGAMQIKAPTTLVFSLGRTRVTSQQDLPNANAIQAQYKIAPLSHYPDGLKGPIEKADTNNVFPVLDLSGVGAGYFDELGALLKAYPPPPRDAGEMAAFASIGVGPGLTPSHDPRLAPLLEAGSKLGWTRVHEVKADTEVNGWHAIYGVDSFIVDPMRRAALTLLGIGMNIDREAIYFSATRGPDGVELSGAGHYQLVFPPGQLPPVNAFWSLTMYDAAHHLVDNPINRYAIQSTMKGLVVRGDGSLVIDMQHTQPTDSSVNWLPAPAGPFRLNFRTYEPRPEIYNGTYKVPRLRLV